MRERMFRLFAVNGLLALVLTACGGGGAGGASTTATTPQLATGSFTRSIEASTFSDYQTPFGSGTWGDIKQQQVYTAAQIGAAGRIRTIRFQHGQDLAAAVTCPNTSIRLGHTSFTSLVSTFADNINRSSLQTALQDVTLTIPPGAIGEWFEIPLATPFEYNGVDNLIVEVERNTACSADTAVRITQDTVNWRTTRSANPDAQPGVADYVTTSGNLNNWYPHIQFGFAGGESRLDFAGATTGNSAPFSFLDGLRHMQMLYLASEINGSGPITGLGFVLNAATASGGNPYEYTVTVKLGHSTLTALTTDSATNFDSGTPVTVTSNLSFRVPAGVPAGRTVWIPLSTPFDYNGTDNLLVEVEVSGPLTVSPLWLRSRTSVARRWIVSTVDNNLYDLRLRFNGAPIQFIPADVGTEQGLNNVFGGSAGGQAQTLLNTHNLGTGGSIRSIGLRLAADSQTTAIPNYRIYLGHRTDVKFGPISDIYAAEMEGGGTLVYDGTLTIPAGLKAGDWLTIPLTTPFTYDPQKHLVVLFTGDAPGAENLAAGYGSDEFDTRLNSDNTSTGPNGSWAGIVDLQLNISK